MTLEAVEEGGVCILVRGSSVIHIGAVKGVLISECLD